MLALIKSEFYGLCAEFYSCELNLESINNSYITLVATINNPEGASNQFHHWCMSKLSKPWDSGQVAILELVLWVYYKTLD